jgi:penicillin amidase
VLHRVAGKVPVRSKRNRIRPVPASLDWESWVTDLPRQVVAEDDVVVTANDRVTPEFDRIGSDFSPPYRAHRIRQLLGERTGLTVDHLAAILTDTWSARAGRHLDEGGGDYIARRDALVGRLAADPWLAPVRGGSPYGRLYDAWFHLPQHLARTLEPGDTRLGDETATAWPHTYRPLHGLEALGISHPLVTALHDEVAVPVFGDGDCVQAMHCVPDVDVCVRGPVARYVWDLADRDNSRWVVPLGASGLPGPHQHDQTELWATGRLAPVTTDWDVLDPE